MNQAEDQAEVTTVSVEDTFEHVLADGCIVVVGKPKGVIRLRLRALLGDKYLKDDELKTIGSAFLSIQKWNGFPSPLNNPTHFDAMMSRFSSEEDLDLFMEKFTKLTQPEFSSAVRQAMEHALENNLNAEDSAAYLRELTMPLAKARLDKLRD